MQPVYLRSHFLCSLRMPKCETHCLLKGISCMRLLSHFFYSFIRNLFQNAADIVFLKVNAVCVGLSRFSLFPTSRWRNGKSCVFPVPCVQGDGMACVFPVPFVRPSSLPVPLPVPFADFLCFSRVCVAILLFWKQSDMFFPRAPERRVLLIVGVCFTSAHLHIFIFTSTQIIFTSPHLHILKSAQLHT